MTAGIVDVQRVGQFQYYYFGLSLSPKGCAHLFRSRRIPQSLHFQRRADYFVKIPSEESEERR